MAPTDLQILQLYQDSSTFMNILFTYHLYVHSILLAKLKHIKTSSYPLLPQNT